MRESGISTHNFDRVLPSHWMNTSRSFALLVGTSLGLIGFPDWSDDSSSASADEV